MGCEPAAGYAMPMLPFWITPEHLSRIESDLSALLGIVLRVPELRFGGDYDRWAQYLGFNTPETAAMRPFYGHAIAPLIARPDGFLTAESLRICELNIDSGIAGIAGAHARFEYFSGHAQLRRMLATVRYRHHCLSPLDTWLRIIRSLPKPVWMIVPDLNPSPVAQRMDLIERDMVCNNTSEVFTVAPESVDVVDNALLVAGRRISSVFRGISDQTMAEQNARFADVIHALAAEPSCRFVAPITTALLENKINLSLLFDPHVSEKLSNADRAVIDRVVPQTHKLDAAVAGNVASNRRNWVLKKASSKSGRHLCIGPDADTDSFDRTLQRAVSDGGWVAQAFVEPAAMENLFVVDGMLEQVACPAMTRVFMLDGAVAGLDCEVSVLDGATGSFRNAPGYGCVGRSLCAVAEPMSG